MQYHNGHEQMTDWRILTGGPGGHDLDDPGGPQRVDDAGDDGDGTFSVRTNEPTYTTIDPDQPLEDGDVLWFAGSASAVGDLRKIPGLVSFESDEVKKVRI